MFLDQLIQGGFFRAPALVVDSRASRRQLSRLAHDLFLLLLFLVLLFCTVSWQREARQPASKLSCANVALCGAALRRLLLSHSCQNLSASELDRLRGGGYSGGYAKRWFEIPSAAAGRNQKAVEVSLLNAKKSRQKNLSPHPLRRLCHVKGNHE